MIKMAKQTIYIENMGWIRCSDTNVSITEDEKGELYRKIKTNAIDLLIPINLTKIKDID